jgi:hypothetical protein
MSKITSGHCITEENVRDKMLEHHNKYRTNKMTMIAKETIIKTSKKRNTDCQKTKSKVNKAKIMDSQMPGPRHIPTTNTNNTSESDFEDEDQISDEEVRESPCLIFTKWVQCDQCRHWVHLIYCTENV